MQREREGVRWQVGQETRWMCSTCGAGTKSRGYFSLRPLPLFILKRVALVVLFEKVWGVNILGWFPGVVAFGVSLPLHIVLEHLRSPMTLVIDQVFDLVLFSALDQIRWRFRKIGAMDGVFLVWQEEGSVEHIVDGPRDGEA